MICIHTDMRLEGLGSRDLFGFLVFLTALDLTFGEFITEGAVEPLATVQPGHGWTHEGSTPSTPLHALWLRAHLQGLLESHTSFKTDPTFHFSTSDGPIFPTSPGFCFARGVTRAPRGSRLSRAT